MTSCNIRLMLGDCLELMDSISDSSIDMVCCDLPYGNTQNKWDQKIDLNKLWCQYRRVVKTGGVIIQFSQQPFTSELVQSNPKMFRYEIIWEKTRAGGFLNANRMPLRAHENILVFYNRLPTYNPQMQDGEPYMKRAVSNGDGNCYGAFERKGTTLVNSGTRYPRDVIKFSNSNSGSQHHTQKPIELLEYLIKTYTNKGDTVLDNTMGSGSTGVACVNTGRNFVGIELDKDIYDIAVRRIKESEELICHRTTRQ